MRTPMPSDNGSVERTLQCIKPEIRAMSGYSAPPQARMRVKLNQNENPFDFTAQFKKAVLSHMENAAWRLYPMNSPDSLRDRLAARYDVTPGQILLGNGSNQLLYVLASAVITPGTRVVIPTPTFSLFDIVMQIAQAGRVHVPKKPDFTLDMDQMRAEIAKAGLTLLCSPDNPTGAAVPLSDLETLLQATSGLVLWDEAYAEFGGESAIPLLERYPNLIVSRTFSKAFGLAGLRIGYFIGHSDVIRELGKANIPYNINSFSLAAANHLLDHPDWMTDHVNRILEEREKLFDQLTKIPEITPYASEANFILFRVPDKTAVFQGLKSGGILVREAIGDCLRVTVGTPEENRTFLEGLIQTLGDLPSSAR